MKRFILLFLFAFILCSCGEPIDSSSVLEVSSVQENSSESVSDDASSVTIPEDEPYVELTALTDEEIANLKLPEEYTSTIYSDGFFTKELIAISFTKGAKKANEPLYVVISRDGGETWEEQVFDDSSYYQNFISFSSEKNGCLIIEIEYYLGGQSVCCAYTTHNGGKSWQQATSPNTVCTWAISDVLFTSRNVGFVCHRSLSESVPVFTRTVDGGLSWEKITLDTEELKNNKASYGYIKTAEFSDGVIEFTVEFCDNTKVDSDRIFYSKYISSDMGQTFEKAE